jgi:hypothetical protein
MNLFAKFLIAALVIAVLLPFTVLKGKDGRPLMSFGDLKAPDIALPELPNTDMGKTAGSSSQGREDIVYKWKDAQGEWHFSSTPPPQGVEYTVKGYDPNTNLIQSVKPNLEESDPVKEPAGETTVSVHNPGDVINAYSPDKIENLFNDAKNVQQLLEDRFKQQEATIGR